MDRQRKFHYTIHNRYTHTHTPDPRHIRQTDNPCPHIYTNADARCIHTTRARPLACRLNTVTYALVRLLLLLHQKRGASRCDERKEILFPSRDVMRASRYVPGVLFFFFLPLSSCTRFLKGKSTGQIPHPAGVCAWRVVGEQLFDCDNRSCDKQQQARVNRNQPLKDNGPKMRHHESGEN